MFLRDFAFVVDMLLVKVILELIGVQREAAFNINILQFLCMLLVELFTGQLFFPFLCRSIVLLLDLSVRLEDMKAVIGKDFRVTLIIP